MLRVDYGGAPFIQFNELRAGTTNDIKADGALKQDMELIEKAAGIGLFYYGPRAWMLGNVEPLQALLDPATQNATIDRVIRSYPTRNLGPADLFYRLRRNPGDPPKPLHYDSPPTSHLGTNRLDSPQLPVLYASQDLEVCVHECRVTVEDNLFVATLRTTRELHLLDLSEVLQENVTEFESLDMAIHMLFLAGTHSYAVSRAIASEAANRGFDGLIYPSYFSLVRLGVRPFETAYGISLRRMNAAYAKSNIIENLGIFRRPIDEGLAQVVCINRLVLKQIGYDLLFGPVLPEP
jgi:RES domain